MRIKFKPKPRKDGSGLFTTDGSDIFIGKDWALQNEIEEVREETKARSCFRECRTCGCCANSRRSCTHPISYDFNSHSTVDCRSCERFRFHDCNNGLMRDSRQEAEPFTEEQIKLIEQSEDGRPLI